MHYLRLALRRCSRGHISIRLGTRKPDGLIQFDTIEPRLFGKNFLTLDVDSLVPQFTRS